MAQLVTLTCASGKQCSHIIPRLYSDPKYKLRLVANRDESVEKLQKSFPNAEITKADLTQPQACARIVSGASTIVHIGPSFHPHETTIGYNMVDACMSASSSAGTQCHFIYSSVLHTQLRKLINHDCKRYVEEYLVESGLQWTILRPTRFMDTFPVPALVAQQDLGEQLVLKTPYNPDTAHSFIALADLGDACVKVVKEREAHFLASYPLCSTMPETYRDMTDVCSKHLGAKIELAKLPREQADLTFMRTLFGDVDRVPLETREAASRMLLYYEDRGLKGSPNVLRWLLGREPTTFEQWVSNAIHKSRGKG
ncbi:MAG: hypothetical protein Q9162_000580 [Coniocarpon cinnabarinum]